MKTQKEIMANNEIGFRDKLIIWSGLLAMAVACILTISTYRESSICTKYSLLFFSIAIPTISATIYSGIKKHYKEQHEQPGYVSLIAIIGLLSVVVGITLFFQSIKYIRIGVHHNMFHYTYFSRIIYKFS